MKTISRYIRIHALEIEAKLDHAFSLFTVASLFVTLLLVPQLFVV